MVVYEIKNPSPTPSPEKPKEIRQEPEPVEGTPPVHKVDRFLRRWRRPPARGKEQGRSRKPLSPEAERSVRATVERLNESLESHAIQIHLVLVEEEDGFALDVYDCSDQRLCRVIRDIVIDVDDLPALLRNLEEEAGIIIDTIS